MAKTEVTQGQFAAFVTDTGYKTKAESGDGCYGWTGTAWEKAKKYNWRNLGFEQTDSHPVACVSWHDAQSYIAWLNKKSLPRSHAPRGNAVVPRLRYKGKARIRRGAS